MAFTFKKRAGTSSRPALHGGIGHMIATDPFLDWILILTISLAVAFILVGVGVSVYLDSRARIEGPASSTVRKPALPLDKTSLDKALQRFEDRVQERSAVLRHWNVPIDPSLPS